MSCLATQGVEVYYILVNIDPAAAGPAGPAPTALHFAPLGTQL